MAGFVDRLNRDGLELGRTIVVPDGEKKVVYNGPVPDSHIREVNIVVNCRKGLVSKTSEPVCAFVTVERFYDGESGQSPDTKELSFGEEFSVRVGKGGVLNRLFPNPLEVRGVKIRAV